MSEETNKGTNYSLSCSRSPSFEGFQVVNSPGCEGEVWNQDDHVKPKSRGDWCRDGGPAQGLANYGLFLSILF